MIDPDDDVDFDLLKADVCRRIDLLAAAWKKSHPAALRRKMRIDVLGPLVDLLCRFCAHVTVHDGFRPLGERDAD